MADRDIDFSDFVTGYSPLGKTSGIIKTNEFRFC